MENTNVVIKSKIPELLKALEMDKNEWRGHCILRGLSADTADKLFDGDINIRVLTLEAAANILGVRDPGELVELV
jgi:hypothetical protein